MSDKEKKELDKKLKELAKKNISPPPPIDNMAMCYCPAPPRLVPKSFWKCLFPKKKNSR